MRARLLVLRFAVFVAILLATTHASARIAAARLASGPSTTCVHDASIDARAKSASLERKSYVRGRTCVGPWLSGKEEDIEVGLTYFGFRYYQPYLGRWASADPLTIHGLGSDLNPYAYVGGRVMNSVDPFGLEPASPGTKDIVQYGNGTWSGTAADGSVEVGKGDPFEKAAAAQSSERGWSGEIDHAVNAWSLDPTGAMGTHVPIGGGNYVTPAEVHNAVQNVARDIVVDGLDPLRLHHVVRGFTGWDPTARLKIRPKSNDPRNKSGIVGTVLGVAGSVAVGGFAEGAEVAGPRVYSVAFQTAIPKLGAGTRPAHFAAANEALLQEMRSSPQMAAAMEELGVQVPTNASGAAKGLSPQGWTWHHVPNQPGVLQLVPRAQHTAGSPFYMLMHPDGRGGFFNWGAAY